MKLGPYHELILGMTPPRSTTVMKLGPYREIILRNAPQEHDSHEGSGVVCMGAGLTPLCQAGSAGHKGALRR